jgi:hypothetical protein
MFYEGFKKKLSKYLFLRNNITIFVLEREFKELKALKNQIS